MTPAQKGRKRTPELFLNRETSWLEFNSRVLEEARDATNPLLERLRFATIVASNLDEFFTVRVAGLESKVRDGDTGPDAAGLTPAQQLAQISERAHAMVEVLYGILQREILPALAARGITIMSVAGLDPLQRKALDRVFEEQLFPALTPLAIDASRPFPILANLSLNLALFLAPTALGEPNRLAVVQVPSRMPRLVRLPTEGDGYVWLEEVIRARLSALSPGQEILASAVFRVTRDSEVDLDDEGGRDFIENVEDELRKRRSSRVVRLEMEAGAEGALLSCAPYATL